MAGNGLEDASFLLTLFLGCYRVSSAHMLGILALDV